MSPAKETINSTSWDTLFGYDTQHRLTTIQGPGNATTPGGTVGFEYTDLSAVARLNLGITEMQLDYDPMGRLTTQTLYSPMQRKYIENTYYPDGKVHTYTQDNVVYSYTYDFAGRLIEWDKGSASPVTYSYDKAGNLLNPKGKSLTFNQANEISNASYSYDDAGNLKQDEKYKYTWDGEGRLSTVTTLADVAIADYTYHYDGLRMSKTVGTDTYYYHYDGSNLVRVTDDNDDTVWAITWSGMSPVMLTNAAGETYYYVTNYRGDVVNILDEDGYPVASYRYDPWGNPEYTAEAASVAGQPIRYASYVYDSETGLYYLQARYYDPETARFTSRDAVWGEMESPLSQNLYAYCLGDPVNYVDPDGNAAANIVGGIIGGVFGALLGVIIANALGLSGWKRWALIGAVTVAGVVVGAIIGPYVAKASAKVISIINSGLRKASSAAIKASKNVGNWSMKKHLANAGGKWNKFNSSSMSQVRSWVQSALRSNRANFYPNSSDSYYIITEMGRVIGTRGETAIKVVFTSAGKIITAYPVR